MFFTNENNHLDLLEWLNTLERAGIDVEAIFPTVFMSNSRGDEILKAGKQYTKAVPDIVRASLRIATSTQLEDRDDFIAAANQVAAEQNTEHRARVADVLERAAFAAYDEAIRRFRRADLLAAIRPTFDTIAKRIVQAADEIPLGTFDVGDAARLGHADTFLQLEKDLASWKEISSLLSAWGKAGMLPEKNRLPIEYMVEDPTSYLEQLASSGRPMRKAKAIAAGQPNLQVPTTAKLDRPGEVEMMNAAHAAQLEDEAARKGLGLAPWVRR